MEDKVSRVDLSDGSEAAGSTAKISSGDAPSMITEKYAGNFTDRDNVAREFAAGSGDRWSEKAFVTAFDFPTDKEIIHATYETPSYEGYAFVLYEHDGKLYEVSGSHCSCYGLEGQWEPEETSWAAIAIRKSTWSGDTPAMVIEEAKRRCAEQTE